MSKASGRAFRAALLAAVTAALANPQDLVPRAYLITPTSANAVTISSSWNTGDLVFDSSVPIENGAGRFQTTLLSLYHSYGLLGRSSNIVVSIPYAVGKFRGEVLGTQNEVYRSGMADARVRLAVNLRGGRAMTLGEFRNWSERTLVGASITFSVPSGQNDPARAINPGTNRWAFKPEVGITRRRGNWVAEGYAGVWLFTKNSSYFPGQSTRTQKPMAALEAHVGYYFKPGLWISFDGNFWTGGRSSVNGVEKQDLQRNSRAGVSFSTPLNRHQSLKFSFSRGTYVTIGGDFLTISGAWQYSWLGKPN